MSVERSQEARLILAAFAVGFAFEVFGLFRPAIHADHWVGAGGTRPAGVNANQAAWWELAELPQVGEVQARRIVEYRSRVPAPAFRRAEDLAAVRGISEKLARRLAPELTFVP